MRRRHHASRHVALLLTTLTLWWGAAAAQEAHGGIDDPHDEGMPDVVHFSAAQRQTLGIATEAAGPGTVGVEVRLVGEVVLNLDRTAHVTSRVSGVVARIARTFGDRVDVGETLAILDSRDLAEARARFLTASAREALAATTHARVETLWGEQISSEREYLAARQTLAEARIARRTAEQMLHALGVGRAELDTLSDDPPAIARYELTAPIAGTVIDRHATVGEMLSPSGPAFVVADLDSVWVDLAVHVQDLSRLRVGQAVRVQPAGDGVGETRGRLDYLTPVIDADTRTATARAVLANDGSWRPGLPVTAWVTVDAVEAAVTVPAAAVHDVEGRDHVFVDDGDGLRLRSIHVDRRSGHRAEVRDGLAAGERVVTGGGVHVKAAFLSAGVGGHHH
jgi:cobalt-zinc-cadmium efflux system membrane fusion protein